MRRPHRITGHRTGRARRVPVGLTALGVAAALALGDVVAGVGGAVPAPVAAAQPGPAGQGPDYATELLGDPWDYRNPEDQTFVEGQTSVGIANGQVRDGQLRFDVSGPSYFHVLWGGYPDTQPVNRDGALRPVDTTRFNRLVMKVTSSPTCPPACAGTPAWRRTRHARAARPSPSSRARASTTSARR